MRLIVFFSFLLVSLFSGAMHNSVVKVELSEHTLKELSITGILGAIKVNRINKGLEKILESNLPIVCKYCAYVGISFIGMWRGSKVLSDHIDRK